ncbi:hypothetical protein Q2T42_18925 [Leptolyngbya boryana CZ1]|uniref:Uncharacterized protein n=1 Tax=Leptolyngbya boryana CZ1 TaxID=3060204 RepID=A0AA97AM81_LEPBY|nr:hypothetical protein [Leptolyngbya boryana]WNZ43912.1 hypothetical protein Q2T42_18925 [Leptolyngbya boryana CZ1]
MTNQSNDEINPVQPVEQNTENPSAEETIEATTEELNPEELSAEELEELSGAGLLYVSTGTSTTTVSTTPPPPPPSVSSELRGSDYYFKQRG